MKLPKNEAVQVRVKNSKGVFVVTRKSDGMFVEYETTENGYKRVGQSLNPYKLPYYDYKGD